MKTSFETFDNISRLQKSEIAERGFVKITQLKHKRGILRSVWRRVRNRSWQGWKTFWRAKHPLHGDCFIKVSFGHDSLPDHMATVDAENEAFLPGYFSTFFPEETGVIFLEPIEHWRSTHLPGTYFICFPWKKGIHDTTVHSLMTNANARNIISRFLVLHSRVPPPEFWGIERESHNYALTDYNATTSPFIAPFNVDFAFSFCSQQRGRTLMLFDLEKYQWSSLGLQEVVLLIFLQLGSKADIGLNECLLQHIDKDVRSDVLPQAWQIIEKQRVAWNVPNYLESEKERMSDIILRV